jgi:hypothetical protein
VLTLSQWVSTAASFYFLHSLIIDAKADPFSNAAELLKLYSFTIVPVLNPDGFAYSHEHSRLWKKNRQNVGGLLCKGESAATILQVYSNVAKASGVWKKIRERLVAGTYIIARLRHLVLVV